MKVGPKLPGVDIPPAVGGTDREEGIGRAGAKERAPAFAEVLETTRPDGATGTAGMPGPGGVADIVARYGTGELTRAEAVRQVAEASVGSWPPGVGDASMRARAVEELTEFLAADPAFGALLDAAGGGAR